MEESDAFAMRSGKQTRGKSKRERWGVFHVSFWISQISPHTQRGYKRVGSRIFPASPHRAPLCREQESIKRQSSQLGSGSARILIVAAWEGPGIVFP